MNYEYEGIIFEISHYFFYQYLIVQSHQERGYLETQIYNED